MMRYLTKLRFFTESKKYIKKYETSNNKLYWLVPTKNIKMEIALKKIGAPTPEDFIREAWLSSLRQSDSFFYVACGGDRGVESNNVLWQWNVLGSQNKDKSFQNDNYKFLGEVPVEDWEINAYKNVIKFNL